MCFSVYFFQTYYSKLGFNWEKAAYLNINYSEQPTLDSKSWQLLIEEIMSHFLWNLWADWLICFVCLLRQMKGEKIKTDNESALLKNQWLLLFHFIVGSPPHPCAVNTHINKIQMWDVIVKKYANCKKGFLFIFIPFSGGFSVLWRTVSWVYWSILVQYSL